MDDHSFTANGQMDDIIYQQECGHHHIHNTSLSSLWGSSEWQHHIHECEGSKDHFDNRHFDINGGLPEFVCLNDCHDPSCDEPPCTECDEDVVVCTNAACSPPPDQGTCDAVAIGNTSCAGEVPCDVLHGASVLNVIHQLSTNDNFQIQQSPFAFSHHTHPGCSLDQEHTLGQGPFYNIFGNGNSGGFNATTAQSLYPSHETGLNGSTYAEQCYTLASQGEVIISSQQRGLPPKSSMGPSYSPHSQHVHMRTPLRQRASISSASSPFSPAARPAYVFSQNSTPSTGTPYEEALPLSYGYIPNTSYTGSSPDQSDNICLYYVNGTECGQVFDNTADLLSHVQELHKASLEKANHSLPAEADRDAPMEPFDSKCLWLTNKKACGQIFETPEQLQNHIQICHTSALKKANGFICQWSGCIRQHSQPDKAGFAQRSKLDRHIQSHTGYKACTCNHKFEDGTECGKHFSTQQSLTLHQRTHTGERPHQCQHCDYAAAQASQLTMHVRTRHTKVKPLVCPFPGCGASFSESSNLSKHKKIHQPGENCPCIMCDRVFRRPDQLKRHMNTTHKTVLAKSQHRRSISHSGPISLEGSLTKWVT